MVFMTAANCQLVTQRCVKLREEDAATTKFILSPGDLNWVTQHSLINFIFVYPAAPDFERLEDALGKLLRLRPYLAGRLARCGDVCWVDASNQGVPLSEIRWQGGRVADVLELHRQHRQSELMPCFTTAPLYYDTINLEDMHAGKDALFRVRLTHLEDGGIFAMSMAHVVEDGMRAAMVFKDLVDLMNGKEVAQSHNDRLPMWPQAVLERATDHEGKPLRDRLKVSPTAKKPVPPILLDAAAKPSSDPLKPSLSGRLRSLTLARTQSSKAVRQGSAEEEDPFGGGRANSNTSPWGRRLLSTYAGLVPRRDKPPPGRFVTKLLHFPEAEVARLKAIVIKCVEAMPETQKYTKGAPVRLSGNDVITALVWMLRSRALGMPFPFEEGNYSSFSMVLDLVANGLPPSVTPPHSSGNLVAWIPVSSKLPGPDGKAAHCPGPREDSVEELEEKLSKAAGTLRLTVLGFRARPDKIVQCTVWAVEAVSALRLKYINKMQKPLSVGFADCVGKVPGVQSTLERADCGKGPAFLCLPSVQPWVRNMAFVTNGPQSDGSLLDLTIHEAAWKAATAGGWLQRLCTGMREL